jgi:hypothetical protein
MHIRLSFSLLEGEPIPLSPSDSASTNSSLQTFLLSTAAEGLSWSQVLDDGRRSYTEQRNHFLKYIKHPEALAELNIDPLNEDPNVSCPRALRMDSELTQTSRRGTPFVKMRLSALKYNKMFSDYPMRHLITKTRPRRLFWISSSCIVN